MRPYLWTLSLVGVVLIAVGGVAFYYGSRPLTSDVLGCQYGVVYGHSIQSLITTNGTTIITGTFNPEGTFTTTFISTGNSSGSIGHTFTVTGSYYPSFETCSYVPH